MAVIPPFGTHPDIPDQRDWIHPRRRGTQLPASVDLRPDCPPVYQQGTLNSCTANAIGAAMAYDAAIRGRRHREPSRLFIYYNERAREGLVGTNAPVSLRDGYRSMATVGVCPERLWPYDPARFRRKPAAECFKAAMDDRAIAYFRLPQLLTHFRACLAERFPFTMGISVYDSFLTPAVRASGRVPMPDRSEAPRGGHAVLVVGYQDSSEHFIVRNSWGRRWGHAGYCFMPYDYLLNPALAFDFWTVRRVGTSEAPAARARRASLRPFDKLRVVPSRVEGRAPPRERVGVPASVGRGDQGDQLRRGLAVARMA